MNKTTIALALGTALLAAPANPIAAQDQTSAPAASQPPAAQPGGERSAQQKPGDPSSKADAYFYFTAGHLKELDYELTSNAESATEAIDLYNKALAIDPDSAAVHERLAEIDAKSQHIRDAVTQAQTALKLDPNNVDAHRLLARIYVRSLGDLDAGDVQQENLAKAVDQFQAILKIDPRDTYSSLWLARLYRFENKHDEAEHVLRGVVKQQPDNEPALEQLSQLLIDEGRAQEAEELLTQAASDSASPDLYDLLGDAYTQSKDYPKAEAAYRKAVEVDPDDPGHRHGLAQALMSENKYAEALEQFKKLSQLEPSSWENQLRQSQLQRHLGQFDEAESSLARARQLAPGNLEILYNEALLDEDEGRFDDAVKVLADAIAGMKNQQGANPNALGILYEQLGTAYREQGNYSAALDAFQQMAKANPEPDSQKRAQMLTIETYRESHQIDQAIAEAQKAVEEYPKWPDAVVTLALLYGEQENTAQGARLLQGLLKGTNADSEIYLDIAQVQLRGKKFADAEQSAQKAEQLAAQDSAQKQTVWFMIGSIYERQKKYDEAEQEFRKVLAVNPDNAPVLNYLGYMLADRGVRIEEATSMIQRALKQEPTNGAYLDSLGWAYYRQNKFTEAEEYLRKAVDREGHDPTILSHLAGVYVKLGQNERAAGLFERSLAEWQKAAPADYEPDKASEVEAQLKNLKKRLAQKSSPNSEKPQ